jgi:hypothetical protein
MVHFLFYAGKAASYKADGVTNPVGSAVQDGYHQELMDWFRDSWSADSYEDLPSDLLGAEFGAEFFDPTSSLSLADQMQEFFFMFLRPLPPGSAPNYQAMPLRDSHNPPMARNHSTNPMFTYSWSSTSAPIEVVTHRFIY